MAKAQVSCRPWWPISGPAAIHYLAAVLRQYAEHCIQIAKGHGRFHPHPASHAKADQVLSSPSVTDPYLHQPWLCRGYNETYRESGMQMAGKLAVSSWTLSCLQSHADSADLHMRQRQPSIKHG